MCIRDSLHPDADLLLPLHAAADWTRVCVCGLSLIHISGVLHVYTWICRTYYTFSGFLKRIFQVPTAVLDFQHFQLIFQQLTQVFHRVGWKVRFSTFEIFLSTRFWGKPGPQKLLRNRRFQAFPQIQRSLLLWLSKYLVYPDILRVLHRQAHQ